MEFGSLDCFGLISTHLKQMCVWEGLVGNGDGGDIMYFGYCALVIFSSAMSPPERNIRWRYTSFISSKFKERLLWMWLSFVKHPMPLEPEAFSLCILTCEMPPLRKYMNFKTILAGSTLAWKPGKKNRIIWSLKPWFFGNLVVSHPNDSFNFPCPFWK